MASPYKPELFSVEDVMSYFEISKGNCFRIYAGTNPKTDDYCRGEYTDGDKQMAESRLHECLISLKQNVENTNCYTIQVFNLDKKRAQVDKSCIVFQLNRPERYSPYPAVSGTDPQLISLLQKQIENQNLMMSKISASLDAEDDDYEEEPEGIIGQILKDEQKFNMVVNGISALVGNFIGQQKPPTYGGGIAGTIDQESVNLLQSLFNKGVDNKVLAKLNEMSEAKLKSLLLML